MEENKMDETSIETKVEEIEPKKSNTGLIIVLVLIILGLVGYIIFTRFNFEKKQPPLNNDVNNTTYSDDSDNNQSMPITYTKTEVEVIKFDYGYFEKIIPLEEDEDPIVIISYPVINGNDSSVISLNNKIKNNVNTYIEEYKKTGEPLENSEEEYGYVVVDSEGKKIFYFKRESLYYAINETEDYLIIEESINGCTIIRECYDIYKETYTINKKTGKVVSHEEAIKSVKNIDKLKNSLVQYIKGENDIELPEEVKKNELASKMKEILDQNKFIIHFGENGNYYFYFRIKDENETYEYYCYYDANENTWSMEWR